MIRQLKLADFFTIGNFVAGIIAILLAIRGSFCLSALLILVAVVLDFLDGKIARLTKQSTELGKQLDSFADLVSFGIWPSVFGFQQGLTSLGAVAVLVYFSMCGMLRLARFNISKQKHFTGIPITVNGVLFPAIYFGLQLAGWPFNNYVLFVYALMGFLMVSKLRIKKL